MMLFGAGAGGGWVLPALVLKAFGFFFACGLYGGIMGAVIGLIGGLFQRQAGNIRGLGLVCGQPADSLFAEEPEHRNTRRCRFAWFRSKVLAMACWCTGPRGLGRGLRDGHLRGPDGRPSAQRCDLRRRWGRPELAAGRPVGQSPARVRCRELRAHHHRDAFNTSRELARWPCSTAGSTETVSFSAAGGL